MKKTDIILLVGIVLAVSAIPPSRWHCASLRAYGSVDCGKFMRGRSLYEELSAPLLSQLLRCFELSFFYAALTYGPPPCTSPPIPTVMRIRG